MRTVGIIGGSGFIGSYVTKKFLEQGFKVRASVTDESKINKYEHLKELPNAENLEIYGLKVENRERLLEFMRGCDIVVHGGTPFQLDVKDPKTELFDPTIQGTENFIEIVGQVPNIQTVVFLSSVASYNADFPMPSGGKEPDATIDETDEPYMSEQSHPYGQAKYLANQIVQKFTKENPEITFDIISVSPVAVMGKALSKREDSTSSGLQYLFKNKIAPNPFVQMLFDTDAEFAMVDVKDVADAIYIAGTTSGLHGRNYLLSSESWKVSDISAMLNGEAPQGTFRVVYKNDLARRELGMDFNPASVPLTDFSS